MADFGDWEDSDAFDTAAPDAEQVARKLHRLRQREGFELADWDRLDNDERITLISIVARLLAWLRRSGALR